MDLYLNTYTQIISHNSYTTHILGFQSQEESGSERVSTSLQIGEVIVYHKQKRSTNVNFVTMKGATLSPVTTVLSPKPAFLSGPSTLVSPPRGGLQIHLCRRPGEVSLLRGTPATPTSDEGLPPRRTLRPVTAPSARTATSSQNLLRGLNEGAHSPGVELHLTPYLMFLLGFHLMLRLGIHQAGPVHLAGGVLLSLVPSPPLGPAPPTNAQTPPTYRMAGRRTFRGDAAESRGVHPKLQMVTVWTLRGYIGIWNQSLAGVPRPCSQTHMRYLRDLLKPEQLERVPQTHIVVIAVVALHPGVATVHRVTPRKGNPILGIADLIQHKPIQRDPQRGWTIPTPACLKDPGMAPPTL